MRDQFNDELMRIRELMVAETNIVNGLLAWRLNVEKGWAASFEGTIVG